jgi:hypothetical protein
MRSGPPSPFWDDGRCDAWRGGCGCIAATPGAAGRRHRRSRACLRERPPSSGTLPHAGFPPVFRVAPALSSRAAARPACMQPMSQCARRENWHGPSEEHTCRLSWELDSESTLCALMFAIVHLMSTLLRTGKAADYLGVTVKTLQRWDREGRLKPGRTDCGRRMYPKIRLDAFMGRKAAVLAAAPVAYWRVSSAALQAGPEESAPRAGGVLCRASDSERRVH